ncbi:MAG: hypothetical protein SFU27_06600 [Thermonemataceae bacterium]|nr:hypothetical protein [Thermonemataceae bacterium]
MKKQERILARDLRIYKRFCEKMKQGYRVDFIIKEISLDTALSESYILKIIARMKK